MTATQLVVFAAYLLANVFAQEEPTVMRLDSQLGLAILPTNVKLITKPEDLYQWSISTARKAVLFNKQLGKHSTGAYINLCNGVGAHFKAVLAEGAANYRQVTQLVTTSLSFDERERFNTEEAIREALEIRIIGIKGENAELLTEITALREEEAIRTEDLEKAREILTMLSRILQERASKATEDLQEHRWNSYYKVSDSKSFGMI